MEDNRIQRPYPEPLLYIQMDGSYLLTDTSIQEETQGRNRHIQPLPFLTTT